MARTSLNTLVSKKKLMSQDRLSKLPEDLLLKILSELPTLDSIRTSLLSKAWRNLWLSGPALDLDFKKFQDDWLFLEFIDTFLESNKERDIKRFKLIYDAIEHDHCEFVSRIDHVIKRGVCHMTVLSHVGDEDLVRMPLSLYSCATLVNLTLYCVVMDDPESELVSLPCVKTMHLEGVMFDGDTILETLISSCLVLEELTIVTHPGDYLESVCVRSQSLKCFKLESTRLQVGGDEWEDPSAEIDAPRLEYMNISDYVTTSFTIHSISPSAKINIDVDVEFDDSLERTGIYDFLSGISTVREMIVSSRTLEVIHTYNEFETLPKFSNLTRLDASFIKYTLEFLPTFLCCCPNLRSLVVEFEEFETEETRLPCIPQCFESSLEFVELKTSITVPEPSTKMHLAMHFLSNCRVLKKLVVNERFSNVINKIRKIPKCSRGCEVVIQTTCKVVSQKSSLFSTMYS